MYVEVRVRRSTRALLFVIICPSLKEGRTEIFDLMTDSAHFILRLYDVSVSHRSNSYLKCRK